MLHAGDTLIYDRGVIDGKLITTLKKERHVDVMVPVRENMIVLDEAIRLADLEEEHAKTTKKSVWSPHPFRKGEEVTLVRG